MCQDKPALQWPVAILKVLVGRATFRNGQKAGISRQTQCDKDLLFPGQRCVAHQPGLSFILYVPRAAYIFARF